MRFESIEQLNQQLRDLKKLVKLLDDAAKRRVRMDNVKNNCLYLDKDGYCTCWHYPKQQTDRDQRKGIVKGRTVHFDNVRKHPVICVACPSYLPKRNIKL
jgi:hypothetical protein